MSKHKIIAQGGANVHVKSQHFLKNLFIFFENCILQTMLYLSYTFVYNIYVLACEAIFSQCAETSIIYINIQVIL